MNHNQLIIIFIGSLFIGSFYNVVALRELTKEDIFLDRSKCVHCGEKLLFIDMIPVINFIFLKGKCRNCKEEISYIYMFGEILTAISYTVILKVYGYSIDSIFNLIFITILILSTITDIKEQIVPNKFIILGTIFLVLISIIIKKDLIYNILNGLISFFLLYILFIISRGKMGGADVKIYFIVGYSIGFFKAMRSLFYASILALLYMLILYLKGEEILNRPIAFIPFINIGVLLTYII